jgi:hypothetical protein
LFHGKAVRICFWKRSFQESIKIGLFFWPLKKQFFPKKTNGLILVSDTNDAALGGGMNCAMKRGKSTLFCKQLFKSV